MSRHGDTAAPDSSPCRRAGRVAVQSRRALIVGGVPGGALETASVMVLNDRGGFCSGVLLAADVVLTAAHCVPRGRQVRVHVPGGSTPVMIAPARIAQHPGYVSRSHPRAPQIGRSGADPDVRAAAGAWHGAPGGKPDPAGGNLC